MTTIASTYLPYSLKGTDWQESVVNETAYSRLRVTSFTPFGYSTNPSHGRTFFAGQPDEPAIGFYLLGNGYRAYSPTLMRLVAADNLSPFERGGLNAYAYCAADPLNNTDPDGHGFSRSASKLIQKLLRGRVSGDKVHLNEKYSSFIALRGDAHRGLNTLGPPANKQTRAGQEATIESINILGDLVTSPINKPSNGFSGGWAHDTFRDATKREDAASRIAKALKKSPKRDLSADIEFQREIFSEGTTAFGKRIERYKAKGAKLTRLR